MKWSHFGVTIFFREEEIVLKMRNSIPVLTEKQVMEIMKKKVKGTVTAMAKQAEKMMQYVTKENLYDQHLAISKGHSAYERTNGLYNSIFSGNTEDLGGVYSNGVGFSVDYLRANATQPIFRATKTGGKKLVQFGSYTDVYGDFVGDDMIDGEWIEEGTGYQSLVPRRGAYIYERTAQEMEDMIARHGFDVEFANIGAEISIEKYR